MCSIKYIKETNRFSIPQDSTVPSVRPPPILGKIVKITYVGTRIRLYRKQEKKSSLPLPPDLNSCTPAITCSPSGIRSETVLGEGYLEGFC